jgi:hypothetical protein
MPFTRSRYPYYLVSLALAAVIAGGCSNNATEPDPKDVSEVFALLHPVLDLKDSEVRKQLAILRKGMPFEEVERTISWRASLSAGCLHEWNIAYHVASDSWVSIRFEADMSGALVLYDVTYSVAKREEHWPK